MTGVQKEFEVHPPLHPQHPEMGARTLTVRPQDGIATVYLAGSDRALLESGKSVRLMGLFNLRPQELVGNELRGEFMGEQIALEEHAPILQWVPSESNVQVDVVMPDATIKKGLAEDGIMTEAVGSIIQFVRFGFGRVDKVSPGHVTVYFAHQ